MLTFIHPDWLSLINEIKKYLVSRWGIITRVASGIEENEKYNLYLDKFEKNIRLIDEIVRTGNTASSILGYRISNNLHNWYYSDIEERVAIAERVPTEFNQFIVLIDVLKNCGILDLMDQEERMEIQSIIDHPMIIREPKPQFNLDKYKKVANSENAIIIFDTNILLIDPSVLQKYIKAAKIVIPAIVLAELDYNKKNKIDKTRQNAQVAIKYIDKFLKDSSTQISIMKFNGQYLPEDLDERNNDDKLITVAIQLKAQGKLPTIVTNDIGLQLKAQAQGIATLKLEELRKLK